MIGCGTGLVSIRRRDKSMVLIHAQQLTTRCQRSSVLEKDAAWSNIARQSSHRLAGSCTYAQHLASGATPASPMTQANRLALRGHAARSLITGILPVA
jgi:hypothetical protein